MPRPDLLPEGVIPIWDFLTEAPSEYRAGLSFGQYAGAPGLNASVIKGLTPLDMFHSMQVAHAKNMLRLDPDRADEYASLVMPSSSGAESFALGEAAHKAILEPDLFEGDGIEEYFQYSPTKGLGTKLAREAFMADPKRPIVNEEIISNAKEIRDAAYRHRDAEKLLKDEADREMSAFAWDPELGIYYKARFDLLPRGEANYALDIKTTRKALTHHSIRWEIKDRGYDLAAIHYRKVHKLITGQDIRFFFLLFITNYKPFKARLFEIADAIEDYNMLARKEEMYLDRISLWHDAALRYKHALEGVDPDPDTAAREWEAYEHEGPVTLTTGDE